MAKEASQLCYLLTIVLSVGFLIWGFMDILKKKQPSEGSQTAVISRQIRGFAFIMLAQVVLVIGGALCFGMSGGVEKLGSMVKSLK